MELLSRLSQLLLATPSWRIELVVLGRPAPQGSKKIGRWGGLQEASKFVKPWRQSVAYATMEQHQGPVIDEPCRIEIDFYFERPKSHYGTGRNAGKRKDSQPFHCISAGCGDVDKLVRATLDGLSTTSGGNVLKDDKLVVELIARKRYAEINKPQMAEILITAMPPDGFWPSALKLIEYIRSGMLMGHQARS